MQATEDARRVLSSRGWLSRVPEQVCEAFLSRSILRTFRTNEAIYHFGDELGGMFGLVDGAVRISLASGEYGPYLAHLGRPGLWFGEAAVLLREPRRVSVTARRPSVVMHLPLAAIDDLIAADPLYWRYIALNAALNLDLCLRAYSDLLVRNPRSRIAAVLTRLAGNHHDLLGDEKDVRIEVTQSELAELAGMSRNAAGRILSDFASRDIVFIGYGHLTVRRLRALLNIVAENG